VARGGESAGAGTINQPEESAMKRLIAALTLSSVALSASALEVGPPYENLNIERALPNIEFAPVEAYVAGSRAPFEQLTLDRALPDLPSRNVQFAESATGGTRTDASNGGGGEDAAESPWANDWNFIAPAP
jgi:hypothetical protein